MSFLWPDFGVLGISDQHLQENKQTNKQKLSDTYAHQVPTLHQLQVANVTAAPPCPHMA